MKTIIALLVLPLHLTASSLGIFASTGAIAVSNGPDKIFVAIHQSDFGLEAPTTTSCVNVTDLGVSYNANHWGLDLGYKSISQLEYNGVLDTYLPPSPPFGMIGNGYQAECSASIQHYGFFLNPTATFYGVKAGCQLGIMLSNGEVDTASSVYPADNISGTIMRKVSVGGTNMFFQPSLEYGTNLSDNWKVSLNLAYLFLNLKNMNETNYSQQTLGSTPPTPGLNATDSIFNRDLSGFSFSIKLEWSTKIVHRPAPPIVKPNIEVDSYFATR